MGWRELAATSHYRTATAIAQELAAGNTREASEGLEELIEAVARSERRALRAQLTRLLMHIMKWREQPQRRSGSWVVTILQAREEIAAIQEEVPSLTRAVIEGLWDDCSKAAARQAEAERGQVVSNRSVSWDEAFETEYHVGS